MKLHEDVQIVEDEKQLAGGLEDTGIGSVESDLGNSAPRIPDDEDETGFEEYMQTLYEEAKVDNGDVANLGGVGAGGATKDGAGTCCIVHTNGIHHLQMVTCGCQGPDDVYLDLMNARFLPTSFSRISTVFTTAVLDDFRLSNLECKVSAYQYWQRLSRLTNPLNPANVSNRYKELLRMSRVWRWMKKLKWAGVGHNQQTSEQPKDGDLSIFCPACPQPGINIPADWKDDPKRYAIDCCPWCRS